MSQDLMGHLMAHHQGQFIVIEAETHQTLGKDDFTRRSIGIDFAVLGIHHDGVFRRHSLGIKGEAELFSLPFHQEFHRSGEIALLGLQADMFQVDQESGQEFAGEKI
jgi:hypothetical protein